MNPAFNYQPFQLSQNNDVIITTTNTNNMNMNMQMPLSMSSSVNPMAMPTMSMNVNSFNGIPIDTFTQNMSHSNVPAMVNTMPNDTSLSLSASNNNNNQASNVTVNDSSSSSQESSVPAFVAERKLLAPDFVPGPYDVICARGAAAANHPGNLRFRKTIKEFVPQYSKATTKLEKSLLVTAIVDSVRDFTPDGGFVKKFSDGNWYEVGDAACREKIGQTLRDQLHYIYKSSTKAKKPRRKELKELKKQKAKATGSKTSTTKKQKKNTSVTTFKATAKQLVQESQPLFKATNHQLLAESQQQQQTQSINALLKSFNMPNNNITMQHALDMNAPMPALNNMNSTPLHNIPMPPLGGMNQQQQQQQQQEDSNELSLTNIFYNAFCDEGLNLDNGLRC